MTTPTLTRQASNRIIGDVDQPGGAFYPSCPPDPMRMLAGIDTRLAAVEQNLLNVLDVLNAMLRDYRLVENDYRLMAPVRGERFDDEARRHGEVLAKAVGAEISR